MKRFILPLLIIFIFISLPAKANDEVKTLLKVLDKSLQNKASYTQQKQRQIDSLKIILRQSRDIRKKVGTAQSLCFEYSSFQKDSALAYAIHMNRFAQESNDKELLIEAKLDYSRILSSMGFFKEALAITNKSNYLLNSKLNIFSDKSRSIITRKLLLPTRTIHKKMI